jgi:hypothetical protein
VVAASPDLLGAGIARRQRRSNRVVGGCDTLDEHLQCEVEQLGHASGINQDVAWLQVAMDDEVAMRVIDRRADRQKQSQPASTPSSRCAAPVVIRDRRCAP